MKQQISLIGAAVVTAFMLMVLVLAHHYTRTEYKIFAYLASDPTPAQVKQHLGEPDEIIPAGQDLTQKGWPLPRVKRNTAPTSEIWIYSSHTGRNYYLSINKEKDCLDYVFSSSS